MTYAKSNNGIIHLINPLSFDFTLCGDASYCEEVEYAWSPCEPESVTCKSCISIVRECRELKLKVRALKIFDVCPNIGMEVVEFEESNEFSRNGWLSPKGDFFKCECAEHLQTANWICFDIKRFPERPKKKTLFKETSECVLRKLGWVAFKDTSNFIYKYEMGEEEFKEAAENSLKIYLTKNITKEQKRAIERYCKFFGVDSSKYLPRV